MYSRNSPNTIPDRHPQTFTSLSLPAVYQTVHTH
jgi:hypothetical protein